MYNSISSLALITWILLVIYAAVILFLVYRGAKKVKDMSSYAVGNVTFSPYAVGLSLAASTTSAATFIINPGFIAYYGFSAVISYAFVYPAAALISLIVLSKGFRKHGSSVKALTMAQWMGTRYNSKGFSIFFAFLTFLQLTFIVLIVVGLSKVLGSALNVSETSVAVVTIIFVFGYMMFGGANSMVYTNSIQAVIKVGVAIILLTSGYQHFSGGIHSFVDKLAAIDPKLVGTVNTSSFLFRDYFEIIVCQFIIGFAIICQPHLITKSLLLKSDKDMNKFLATAVITLMLLFIVVITGLYARIIFPTLTNNGAPLKLDGVIPAYVMKEFPVYLGVILVMGLLSSGLATLEGLIQSISTTITTDIITPLGKNLLPKESAKKEKTLFFINKVVIVFMAAISIYFSIDQLLNPKLSVGIFAQNGVYAYFSAAFVPILFGLFLKKTTRQAAVSASVAAILVHFTMYYGKIKVPFSLATGENPGVAAAIAIVTSLIIGYIVYLFTKESAPEVLAKEEAVNA